MRGRKIALLRHMKMVGAVVRKWRATGQPLGAIFPDVAEAFGVGVDMVELAYKRYGKRFFAKDEIRPGPSGTKMRRKRPLIFGANLTFEEKLRLAECKYAATKGGLPTAPLERLKQGYERKIRNIVHAEYCRLREVIKYTSPSESMAIINEAERARKAAARKWRYKRSTDYQSYEGFIASIGVLRRHL